MVPMAAQEALDCLASSRVFERDSFCSIMHLLPEQCAARFIKTYMAGLIRVDDMCSSGWYERPTPADLTCKPANM